MFFFGSLVGDSGNDLAAPCRVNAVDLAAVKVALNGASPVTGRADFNRDGVVNALDLGIVKANLNRALAGVTVVPAPVAPAAVFEAVAPRRAWEDAGPDVLA